MRLIYAILFGFLIVGNSYATTIILPKDFVQGLEASSSNQIELMKLVKKETVKQLMYRGFTGFETTYDGVKLFLTGNTFTGSGEIGKADILDLFLIRNLGALRSSSLPIITIDTDFIGTGKIFLFKTTDDLKHLGYSVVSKRTRINRDAGARRANIAQTFNQIGPIRVINSKETLNFISESNFDPLEKKLYKNGFVIKGDDEIREYGGGICGGSTAIYQSIVTNKSLSVQTRSHSNRYKSYYSSVIDGESIKTPGIDSTIYVGLHNLLIKNTADYPMILVMNYNGIYGGVEENFSLGTIRDKGEIQYVRKYRQKMTYTDKGKRKSVNGTCYERIINNKTRTSCYREIK